MERRSYTWFERRRRSKALELAQHQITKALDTITLLHKSVQNITEAKKEEAMQNIEQLFNVEEEVDKLRREVFKEISSGVALFSDYREDLMHLVKRLDTLADYVKDAARCTRILVDLQIPEELWNKTVHITSTLVKCASTLRNSIENLTQDTTAAMESAKQVEDIESEVDKEYLETKALFVKYAEQMNMGAIVIFNDLVEFIEQAADMCADTADYIVILASRE